MPDDDKCGGEECTIFDTKTPYHEGCDGPFCTHGICQECGALLEPTETRTTDEIIADLRATQDDWPAALVVLELEAADRLASLQRDLEAARRDLDFKGDEYAVLDGDCITLRAELAAAKQTIERVREARNGYVARGYDEHQMVDRLDAALNGDSPAEARGE